MAINYPISFSAQLRQHLRALRKKRGLTQAQLGAFVGVSQVRIAEIEANPGLVSFEQLMQVFSMLGVSIFLSDPQVDANEVLRDLANTTGLDAKEEMRKLVGKVNLSLDSNEELRKLINVTGLGLGKLKKGSW